MLGLNYRRWGLTIAARENYYRNKLVYNGTSDNLFIPDGNEVQNRKVAYVLINLRYRLNFRFKDFLQPERFLDQ